METWPFCKFRRRWILRPKEEMAGFPCTVVRLRDARASQQIARVYLNSMMV